LLVVGGGKDLSEKPLVIAENLEVYFPVRKLFGAAGYVRAVDKVDLEIFRGETLALVGESGSR
jgi:ABC-type oligopeptide transport system ATPase subunit